MVPNGVPDILFEARMFPVSFLMISSQSSHFPSLSLTCSQRGAFGGLLPGLSSVAFPRTSRVALSPDGEDEDVDVRPAKCVIWAKVPVHSGTSVDDSDDDGEDVQPVKCVKVKAREPEAAPRVPVPADNCVCLCCSKRIHLELSSTSREWTVSTGLLCDLGLLHKYTYCAHTKHDCEQVS
jgi:hypothetical protein